MTKLIGMKALQNNAKLIRGEVEKGTTFIVVYRSKPVFEIRPLTANVEFTNDFSATGLYHELFLKKMVKAEKDIKTGKLKTYTTEEFLKSLS